MGRSGIIVTGLIAIVLVVGGIFAFKSKDKNNQPSQNQSTSTPASSSTNNQSSSANPTVAATITYNGSLFSPSQVTINKGESVTIKNDSKVTVDFESDPHPTHTNNTELNAGPIEAGKSVTITINKVGSWGYHNHLDPAQTGTIVVR